MGNVFSLPPTHPPFLLVSSQSTTQPSPPSTSRSANEKETSYRAVFCMMETVIMKMGKAIISFCLTTFDLSVVSLFVPPTTTQFCIRHRYTHSFLATDLYLSSARKKLLRCPFRCTFLRNSVLASLLETKSKARNSNLDDAHRQVVVEKCSLFSAPASARNLSKRR